MNVWKMEEEEEAFNDEDSEPEPELLWMQTL